MARFNGVSAAVEGRALRVRFELDAPCVVGWQIYDPATGAFLFEGEWTEIHGTKVDMRVALPEEDGPYRVQVAPVEDRGRFVIIDARMHGGTLEMSAPRVATLGDLGRERFRRALPKVFSYPPRSLWRNRKLIRSM